MANEIVTIERLTQYNSNIMSNSNILQRNKEYIVDNVVNKGQIYLKCKVAGITDTATLPLTGVSVDDELVDGTVTWLVISTTGVNIDCGTSIKDWKPSTLYKPDNVFVYENEIYKVLVKHTSPSDFIELPILEEYTPSDWQSDTLYNVGDIFIESNILYEVLTSFTSGATFSVTSDIEVYTPKTFAEGVDVYIDDIVLYSGVYYKALYDFVCGYTFSLYAFEKYVPHELTEEEVNNVVSNFNPTFRGTVGGSAGVNYSTEEQLIGTWVDGKPLYEITIIDQTTSVADRTRALVSFTVPVDTLVSINGSLLFVYESNTYFAAINSYNSATSYSEFHIGNGTIQHKVGSDYLNCPCNIILQYTKTTD